MEIWKDIKGFEGLYQVSSKGNVKSLKRDTVKILKPIIIGHKPNNLYYAVNLYNNQGMKQRMVHRLVAENHMDNFENLPLVNHKDENTFNNELANLEWCTHQYNQEYSLSKKIYEFISPSGEIILVKNVRKFSRENNLNHAHMYQIAKGNLKSYKGWKGNYANSI